MTALQRVRRASRPCLDQASLGSGCFVPCGTPVENLQATVEASETHDHNLTFPHR